MRATLLHTSLLLAPLVIVMASSSSEWQPMTPERHAHIQATKSTRMHQRRERVRRALANSAQLTPLSPDELATITSRAVQREEAMVTIRAEEGWENTVEELQREAGRGLQDQEHQWIRQIHEDVAARDNQQRKMWGQSSSSSNFNPYSVSGLASETNYYDKWQQAYRFLGGFIDCDHSWTSNNRGGGSHDNHNGNQGNNQNKGCSRWMMWAAYIDPNYAGGGYDEYFGDDAPGSLDCHSPDSDWVLIGVYRQEFYQYIEQISKHLWAIDEYEYIVALAGLKYMTKYECFNVGNDEKGNQLYASVQPLAGGYFQMGLYSDAQCIVLNQQTSYTYDNFAQKSDLNLGDKDQTNDDAFHKQAYQYWYDSQEYSFQNVNTVYNDFKYCTSCVDYPTYQDGYFIGDDGTDDDDLINQCWKFYSHSSYNCDADCIAMGSAQGTITAITYNGKQFGQLIDGQSSAEHDKTKLSDTGAVTVSNTNDHQLERLKANLFLTVGGIVFVATFLAFAVARGSSKKSIKPSSRSRRLLDSEYGDRDGRRSSRSTSRSYRDLENDARSSKSRSKSRSRAAVSSSSKSRSKSRTHRDGNYKAPSESEKSSDYEKKSSSERESERRSRRTSSSSKNISREF